MKINRRKVVDGALYVGELGVDFCAGYFIGAVAEALTPPAAKPVVKVLIKVGSLGAGFAAAYGLEACRMDLSTLINGAFDKAEAAKELRKVIKELKKSGKDLKETLIKSAAVVKERVGEEVYERLMELAESEEEVDERSILKTIRAGK